jgi:hypothetical protein
MLCVSKKSWHARIYIWWYELKYGSFTNTSVNLCPYMRAIMFWAPLRLLFTDAITFFEIESLGDFPVCPPVFVIPALLYGIPKMLGYWSYDLKMGFWLFYVIAVVIVISILIAAGIVSIVKNQSVKSFFTKTVETTHLSTFGGLLSAFFKSVHDGICPPVNLEE